MKRYLVGGAVRDRLLNRPSHDSDWVVVGSTPAQMLAQGFEQVGHSFPVFLHPKTKEEYALARKERKQGHGYLGFVCDFGAEITLEQDLYRRDLTINAIAQDPEGQIIDPYHGQRDLHDRCLRHVSEAFVEDPLRVLRVARFAAQLASLNFSIAEETLALMTKISQSGELQTISVERIWAEWHKALLSDHPERFIEVLHQCKALEQLLPELEALFGVPQPAVWHPEIDTGRHTLLVARRIAELTKDPKLRFVAHLHDLGKALTDPNQWPSHAKHEILGLDPVRELCERLKVPTDYHDDARLFCRYHTDLHKIDELKCKTLLKMFNQLDLWRKPDRVKLMMLCAQADYQGRLGFEARPYPQAMQFQHLYQVALQVDVKAIVNSGFKGEAIKNELYHQRLTAIRMAKRAQKESVKDELFKQHDQ